jgi:hypothetical protein
LVVAAATVMLRGPDVVAAIVGMLPDGAEGDIVTTHVPAASAVMVAEFPPVAADAPSANVIGPPATVHTLIGDAATPTL